MGGRCGEVEVVVMERERDVRGRGRGEIEMAVPVASTHDTTAGSAGSGGQQNACARRAEAAGVLVPRDLVVIVRGRSEIEMAVPVEITHGNTRSTNGIDGHHNLCPKSSRAVSVGVLVPRDLVAIPRVRGRGEIEIAIPVKITHGHTLGRTGSGGHHNLFAKQGPTGHRIVAGS